MSFGARRQHPVLKSPDSPSPIPFPTQFLVISFSPEGSADWVFSFFHQYTGEIYSEHIFTD